MYDLNFFKTVESSSFVEIPLDSMSWFLPWLFFCSYKGHVETSEAKAALCKADTLLSMKHGLVRLDNVWGVGGGDRPVKYLIKKIVLLLKEYLCSGDIKEATRCLQELEVPHFHHELVYEVSYLIKCHYLT